MKRGMILPDNTLELLIVGIVVVLLFTGGMLSYNRLSGKNEEKNAQNFLNSIVGKYDSLEAGQNNSFIFQGFKGGENWFLVAWSGTDSARPEKCFLASCVCICRKGDSADSCQTRGFCRTFSEVRDVSVRNPTSSCTTSGSLALAYTYNPHSSSQPRTVSGNRVEPDISQTYDYLYPRNVLLYRKTIADSSIQLSRQALALDIHRSDTGFFLGSNSDTFLGSADNADYSNPSLVACKSSFPYKAVFRVQNSIKDKIILVPEVYMREYSLESVEFEFYDG